MSFATKLCHIQFQDGSTRWVARACVCVFLMDRLFIVSPRDIMKMPTTDKGKISLPGELMVLRDERTGVSLVEWVWVWVVSSS